MKALQSVNAKGLNHDQSEGRGVRCGSREELPQGCDDEDREGCVLDGEQDVLDLLADLDSAPAHPRHRRDEDDSGDGHEGDIFGEQRVLGRADDPVDQRPEVDAGDLSEVREHDHARDRHTPPAHPSHPRPERLRAPGECGPAVRHCIVELAVREGDEQHRDEREYERDRRLSPDGEDDESQGRNERVHGRGRGEADDGGAPKPQRSCLQTFSVGSVEVDRCCGHIAELMHTNQSGQAIESMNRPDFLFYRMICPAGVIASTSRCSIPA